MGEGLSYYTWYIPKYAGVDQETGLSMWYKDVKDAKGNVTGRTTTTTYSEATNYLGESSLPDLYGGFTTAFEFYGVDISAAFAYQMRRQELRLGLRCGHGIALRFDGRHQHP